ncbi:molybdenum cofactor guanylyltransferase [Planosporangium sp. 12N6]|uniref:molybdenum cofactor guanylyltransferase n=1 Tax=Planosporangium spinosum TaxID=3402278 RepID=UPI003CF259DE
MTAGYAAIVLAGGGGRRLGGRDKPALPVGGRSMLLRVLDAVGDASPRIVVGPDRPELDTDVVQVREHPPGGGPVAGLAAGLAALDASSDEVGLVAVLAADLPFLTAADIRALRRAAATIARRDGGPGDRTVESGDRTVESGDRTVETGDREGGPGGRDGAVLVDADGHPQWLCGVWRLAALRRRLAELGPPAGQSMRALAAGLRPDGVGRREIGGPPPWYDCDTDDDYRRAEEWA